MQEQSAAPGLVAFDSLRAEDEPWLASCFVPPPDFDLIAGARSVLVFGPPGSGKTALFQALRRHLNPTGRLVVEWQPPQPDWNARQPLTAEELFHHLLSRLARTLLAYLADRPERFTVAPSRQTLSWLIYRYLGEEISPQQEHLLGDRMPNPWLESCKKDHLISELVKALREADINATVVLVNLEESFDAGVGISSLKDFFSTLNLVENRGMVYKVVAPVSLRTPLAQTGSIDRRRVDPYTLRWPAEELTAIVVQRLALAAGAEIEHLQAVCEDAAVRLWLERTGGDSPRGWLESFRPLAAHYLRRRRPILSEEWRDICKESAPPLMFEPENPQVVITGWRRIDDLPDVPLALLRYLYDHRDRVCSREELFHRAYLPARYPNVAKREQELGIDYSSLLDTMISRLRDRIEPNPASPVYVVTSRGRGYKLENAW